MIIIVPSVICGISFTVMLKTLRRMRIQRKSAKALKVSSELSADAGATILKAHPSHEWIDEMKQNHVFIDDNDQHLGGEAGMP